MSNYAKVYISMPEQFLAELDKTAEAEHMSRSALIREAVKLYVSTRRKTSRLRFLEMSDTLRGTFSGRTDDEIEQRIDRAVRHARSRRGG